jgi:hypothetical protein
MKLELRNLKINLAFSEETTCFTATLYVEGVRTAECRNEGHGGSTDVRAFEGRDKVLLQAEQYCLTLPPVKYNNIEIKSDIEFVVDELVEAELKRRDQVQMQKRMITKLVMQKGHKICTVGWGKTKIADVPPEALARAIEKYTAQGYRILNTNLPKGVSR